MPSTAPDETRRILDLVASGRARSRSQLADHLGVAASTVGLRVQALLDSGMLQEAGEGSSRGGRRPRMLKVADDGGIVLTADLGGGHARVGRHGLSGAVQRVESIPIDLTVGPEATLATVGAAMERMITGSVVRAIGIGLPGPVHIESGSVDQPSRMPGWAGFRVGEHLAARFGDAPVVVDNDANLAALGEHRTQFGMSHHSITVKAGTAIGSGIIVAGHVHRGANGAAGDITHTRIEGAGDVPCSCGNTGCLETVASGAGLVRQMNERGFDDIRSAEQVLAHARDAHPVATTLVRTAGTHLGQALSGVVNFFNPHAVFLTGSLSASEPFLAAVRSRVYEACHPLATQSLRIEAAGTGPDAIILGAARLALDALELPAA